MIFPGNSQITGVGSFIPKEAVSSVDILEDLKTESRLGIPSTWMDDHLGIISRRYCEEDDLSSEISTIAALRALEDAGIEPKDLNAIIYCGITGDFIEPGTAHVIQDNLGASDAICKDVKNASHGFCDGMFFADMMIREGAEHILVVTAETTRVARLSQRTLTEVSSPALFFEKMSMLAIGDAAGAMILSTRPSPDVGIKLFSTVSTGNASDLYFYDVDLGVLQGAMKAEETETVMLEQLVEQLEDSLDRANWRNDEIQAFVMHQVGKNMFNKMKQVTQFTSAQTPKTYEQYGDITTATLPVNLELIKANQDHTTQKLSIFSGGGGIITTWILVDY